MRQILSQCILPFFIAMFCISLLSADRGLAFLMGDGPVKRLPQTDNLRYIYNFHHDKFLEEEFLKQPADSPVIYLLGSSELTSATSCVSYQFISDHFPVKVMGVGHEGNQCFSMYCQLLANAEKLKGAPLVIILSPGWFEAKPARGTTSVVFLEYNSEKFMRNVLNADVDDAFKAYACAVISKFYDELNAPAAAYRMANARHLASKSFYHQLWWAPIQTWQEGCDIVKDPSNFYTLLRYEKQSAFVVRPAACTLNWEDLMQHAKIKTLSKATNNALGIENEYYTQYIHGKTGKIQKVDAANNTELQDFKMLVQLLKSKKANASFIISPLNPFYFTHLAQLQPTVDAISGALDKNKFPYLNLFSSDTTAYDKALLSDVMHMSDYGWLQVDQFIVKNYGLCR